MIAVEKKGTDPNYTWENRLLQSSYEDIRTIEKLAARTGYPRNSTKCNITGSDFNLPQADWNGSTEGTTGNQAFVNRSVREKVYPSGCVIR